MPRGLPPSTILFSSGHPQCSRLFWTVWSREASLGQLIVVANKLLQRNNLLFCDGIHCCVPSGADPRGIHYNASHKAQIQHLVRGFGQPEPSWRSWPHEATSSQSFARNAPRYRNVTFETSEGATETKIDQKPNSCLGVPILVFRSRTLVIIILDPRLQSLGILELGTSPQGQNSASTVQKPGSQPSKHAVPGPEEKMGAENDSMILSLIAIFLTTWHSRKRHNQSPFWKPSPAENPVTQIDS